VKLDRARSHNIRYIPDSPDPPLTLIDHISRLIVDGGAHDQKWDTYTEVRRYTNAFVWDEKNAMMLLGYKNRGFGANMYICMEYFKLIIERLHVTRYNGFGGKVEPNESSLDAAKRELKEEAGIDAPLEHAGILFFKSSTLGYAHHIDIYRANVWEGTPTESEEMRPEWFSTTLDNISLGTTSDCSLPGVPYERMWEDDKIWFPLLLAKTPFVGRVDFGRLDGKTGEGANEPMVKWWFASVSKL